MPKSISMGSVPEDDDFRKAVADARPLSHRRKHLQAKRPAPVAKQRIRDESAALAESLGPVSADDALDTGGPGWKRCSARTAKNLRKRGQSNFPVTKAKRIRVTGKLL